ncbi:tRNA (adenosine(37)-N6)-threonylcarbamoyltransferase complex transferase subunit TsaD [Candidatus Uhrbacteria bacterium]|nr:tRNA (adenosine(37)-N6)-threonylcarbamoyltransferase complex transferase subunit TsaD [Candidatus Uhrbacteria bacterium]
MIILGIESSCDETAAAVLEVRGARALLVSNVCASQVSIHAKTGGVVPEVAARNHVGSILAVITKAYSKRKPAHSAGRPDYIAVTVGPGLVTSVSVGVACARALSVLWNIPIVAVNHIEGHLYSNWLPPVGGISNFKFQISNIEFPALVLIASGGHTELILMRDHGKYKKVGQTLDDAVGEAFDKVAKILGLGYPGGPAISRHAESGDSQRFDFPRALLNDSTRIFDFSFSGLKTSVLYCVRELNAQEIFSKEIIPDLCASFQRAAVDVLVAKTSRAAQLYRVKSVLLGGGVVANAELRSRMQTDLEREAPQCVLHIPALAFCTDNAAMIAMAGYFHAQKNDFTPLQKLDVKGGWEL